MKFTSDNYIGIFDSGFGGISVLNSLINLMPAENYVYYADSGNFPYGKKSKNELVSIGKNIINMYCKSNAKIVVIACNTMSTCDMDSFQESFPNIKIIGTFPSFIPMLTSSLILSESTITYNSTSGIKVIKHKKKLLVIATTSTCKSKFLTDLVKNSKTFLDVYVEPADFIANAVEKDELNTFKFKNELRAFFKEYADIDFLLLGCTHFPFAIDCIREILGNKVDILSSGDTTVNDCFTYLSSNGLLEQNSKPYIKIVDKNINSEKTKIYERLINTESKSHSIMYTETI